MRNIFATKVSSQHCILHFSAAEAGIFSTCSGKTVPQGVCALLYDDDDCSGWKMEVPIGYKELPRFSLGGPRKDDAESVLVRPGCKFIGKGDSGHLNF